MVNFSVSGLCGIVSLTGMLFLSSANAFYMPGVRPQSFKEGEEVPLKVNSMTSIRTQIPKNYYRLKFCEPKDGPKMASENLGEFLTGNKIQNSPYTINMKQEVYCNLICQVKLTKRDSFDFKMHIKYGYNNNWIIDNLPSASIAIDQGKEKKHYAGGFPIGYFFSKITEEKQTRKEKRAEKKQSTNLDAYIYNHVNIVLDYHEPEPGLGYRVVGFSIVPMSVKHKFMGGYE